MPAGRPRVLYLIGRLSDDGGAERFVTGLATHVPQDRLEPLVCAPRGADPSAVHSLAQAGVELVDLGRRGRWDVHRLSGLAGLLRRRRVDIIHAHLFGSNLWGTTIGTLCRVPVLIAHEHTWSYEGARWRAWLDGRVIGRLATRFLSVSEADARRMISYEHVPADKVVVMPTAYIPRPEAPAGDLRTELGLDRGTPLIATAVVLRPQKALEVLLAAHARLLRRQPDANLAIAGDGPCGERLRRLTAELGIERSVHFLGTRRDVDSILAAADVAALSSDFEGMPLLAFECMANRTPLVATAVGGLTELLQDGTSGVLVPPRDPQALATALAELLEDAPRRAAIASAAAARLAPYRIDVVAERFAVLYEQLLAEADR
jgi:glycosyltransferase involved in cell wall biosynthesis